MRQQLKLLIMTIRNVLTLRNLFIILCSILLVLIAVKGYFINRKIAWVAEAERLFQKKDLIAAEEWYQKTKNNRWIEYKEDQIHSRLQALAPITEIKVRLADLNYAAISADPDSDNDFGKLIQAYSDLSTLRNKYMKTGSQYSSYYKQISVSYQVTEHFVDKFKGFEQRFSAQMDSNLDRRTYENESFRNNLLQIPAAYYGSQTKRTASLSAKFKKYDSRKLTQMSGSGFFGSMLSEALSLSNKYKQLDIAAPWIKKTAESLADQMLRSDMKTENYTAFASHAKDYVNFVDSAKVKSPLTGYISTQTNRLIKKAKAMVARGEFQQAISLYQAVAGFRDTSKEIEAAKLAWTKAEPIRLLQAADSSKNYLNVIGGSNRYGAKLYAAGSDETGRIYYAAMDASDQTKVISTSEFPQGRKIRSISIEKQLSTSSSPVILVEGESSSRKALYSAFSVQEGQMTKLFEFEADGYQATKDGTLLVNNPEGAGAGQTATYAWTGNSYQYQEEVPPESEYADIALEELLQHPGEKVRFTCSIVSITDSGPLAVFGDSYLLLKSGSLMSTGDVTVSGTLAGQNEDVALGGQVLSLPVFEVAPVE